VVEEAELGACRWRAGDEGVVVWTCFACGSVCLRWNVLRPGVDFAACWIEVGGPQYVVYSVVLMCLVTAIYQAFAAVFC